MDVNIYQGNEHRLASADINIVIDVIRAFTVAHYAFLNGAKEILLAGTIDEAFDLKEMYPHYLLAGEVKGLPIDGFDLDNSPYRISMHDLTDRTLVQKTTNGVKATLHALDARHVFVTGFSNAKTTARYIRSLCKQANSSLQINIVASHPTSEEDLACAEYLKEIVLGGNFLHPKDVVARIKASRAAEKFFDETKPEFDPRDISICTRELNSSFVMKVNQASRIPSIERIQT
ncbi:2-phosphosulfolactate phosphatase [Bacillus sp. CECT 9360]|uniref:2-phosphosulfolactate phosphatase n=1 Tax=Bacillus sp. CECT 9360 TaxID=2845821 RepID=UPI001E304858|nr:2-phosphosulfolactate phosphatase [Bacillus sp. CECT 9360]CAH0345430.1 2-phosphosulfolactate phosphatase [Bacillus sp. CECT 9360]